MIIITHIFRYFQGTSQKSESEALYLPRYAQCLACLHWLALTVFFVAVSCNRQVFFCSALLAACSLAAFYIHRSIVFSRAWPLAACFFGLFWVWLAGVSLMLGQTSLGTMFLWAAGMLGGFAAHLWGAAPLARIVPVLGYALAVGLIWATAFPAPTFFTSEGRFEFMFAHPNPFGIVCACAALSLFYGFAWQSRVVKALRLLAFAVVMVALVKSHSRASLIALLCALFAYSLFSLKLFDYKLITRTVCTIIISLSLYSAASVYLPIAGPMLEKTPLYKIWSVSTRLPLWESGLESIKNHPLVGLGFRSFRTWHISYIEKNKDELIGHYGKEVYYGDTIYMEEIHNQYFEILQFSGYIGFFLFMGFVFLSARSIPVFLPKGFSESVLIFFLIIFLFESPLYNKTSAVLFFFFSGLCNSFVRHPKGVHP